LRYGALVLPRGITPRRALPLRYRRRMRHEARCSPAESRGEKKTPRGKSRDSPRGAAFPAMLFLL